MRAITSPPGNRPSMPCAASISEKADTTSLGCVATFCAAVTSVSAKGTGSQL